MEKEFIPYEQAVELKELGFDEPCFGYYNNLGRQQFILSLRNLKEDNNDSINYFSAPLYQQAFRWFREKYGLWQIVMQNTDKDWTYDIMTIIGMIDYKIFDVFDTYEEAELACLIKLIEITKTK